MAEGEYSTLRNLLLVVVALLVLSVGSAIYLGRVMAENSVVFEKIYTLLESGMSEQFTGAMTQAEAMEKKLTDLNKQAETLEARLEEALPKIMDKYIQERSERLREDPKARQQLAQAVAEILRDPEVRQQLRLAFAESMR